MFDVKHYSYWHPGRTKDYDLWIVSDTDRGESMLIRRWGKTDQKGQTMQRIVKGDGHTSFYAEHEKRLKKDYNIDDKTDREDLTGEDALSMFTAWKYAGIDAHLRTFLYRDKLVTGDVKPTSSAKEIELKRPETWGTW